MNYEMVAISRQTFEEVLGGKTTPKTTMCIERFCDCPIDRIPTEDLLKKIAVLYPGMGLIKNIDINRNTLIIHHGLTDPEAIKKLTDMFVELLQFNGQTYDSIISENLIVMKRQPEVGKIITTMIDDIKPKNQKLSDYQADLVKMLKILKNVPSEEEFIKSFGSKFGKKMIQNYENDKKIDNWDACTFLKYLQETGVILGQGSRWENVSENVIHGEIIPSSMVKDDSDSGVTSSMFINGIFNGWVSHAFGDPSKIVYKNTAEGENCSCEIYIAL